MENMKEELSIGIMEQINIWALLPDAWLKAEA
jgi:hypothetical protein